MSDFGQTTNPVGRKDYTCEWCGEPIPEGEKHFHYAGVWEGDWQNWRMHAECYEISTLNDAFQDGFAPFENARPVKASK